MKKEIYKNLIILLVGLIGVIIIIFLVSLTRNQGTTLSEQGVYTGFLKLKKGNWAEIVSINRNGGEDLQRSVYLGEKIIYDIPVYGIEMEAISHDGKNAITQVWLNQETNRIIEIVSKLKGKNEVVCIDESLIKILIPSFNSLLPAVKTPVKYDSSNEYIYDTFTTKSGKKIPAAKFVDENNVEIWISSEVPFGIVKMTDNTTGKIASYLNDYGFTGDEPKISEFEMMNCEKIDLFNFSNILE